MIGRGLELIQLRIEPRHGEMVMIQLGIEPRPIDGRCPCGVEGWEVWYSIADVGIPDEISRELANGIEQTRV
jgi:hypothetical protein